MGATGTWGSIVATGVREGKRRSSGRRLRSQETGKQCRAAALVACACDTAVVMTTMMMRMVVVVDVAAVVCLSVVGHGRRDRGLGRLRRLQEK